MTWYDINMGQFTALQNALQRKYKRPEQKLFELARIVFGRDIQEVPLVEINKYYDDLSELMNSPVPERDAQKQYTLNGRKYYIASKIDKLTTAQYIDFTNLAKEVNKNMVKILGVFLIPEGHKYNDGYDIDEVYRDIEEGMNAVEGNAVIFFIVKQSRDYMKLLVYYSALQIMRTRKWKWTKRLQLATQLLQGWRNLDHLILP